VQSSRNDFGAFTGAWEDQVSTPFPLPGFDPGESGGFRVEISGYQAGDVTVFFGTVGALAGGIPDAPQLEDRLVINAVRQGMWRFTDPGGGDAAVASSGRFVVRAPWRSTRITTAPGTRATVLVVPAEEIGRNTAEGFPTGSLASPEARVLMAHVATVGEVIDGLSAQGLGATRDALVELSRGVVHHQLDDTEPALEPALARAAMTIADALLDDPSLSPELLAGELSVSVRTLHRAFGVTDETPGGYIRRRRLERARGDLAAPGRLPVADIAARWQFADSSHFVRAFKRRYGETPAQYARSLGGPGRAAPPRS
jgi:AraC family transcriptional activator of tynA and feaB